MEINLQNLFERDSVKLFEESIGSGNINNLIPEFRYGENYIRKDFPYLSAAVYYKSQNIRKYLLKICNIYAVDSLCICYYYIILHFIALVN